MKKELCDRIMDVEIFEKVEDSDRFRDPFWELFMWAVLCNMPKMAEFLWPFGENQMAKALIGSEILKVLATLDVKYKQGINFESVSNS